MATLINTDVSFPELEDRLSIATRAWLLWLQSLFASRRPGQYRWSPELDVTEILITDQESVDTARSGKRPMIITTRGPAGFAGLTIGQQSMPQFAGHAQIVSDLVNSSIVLTVVAREGIQAQSIAYNIFQLVPFFRAPIARLGRMHQINHHISLGPEQPWPASPDSKMVQLQIVFSLQDNITSDNTRFTAMLQTVEDNMLVLATDVHGTPV